MHAQTVKGTWFQSGDVTVPDLIGKFWQNKALDLRLSVVRKDAEFNALRMSAEHSEIDALVVAIGAKTRMLSRQDFQL
jgi:hypothetical protein